MIYQGLTNHEVINLRKKYGQNVLPSKSHCSWLEILISQFKSPLIYILFIVVIVSLFFGETADALLVITVIVLNVLMGFFQEFSSQKTLASLRNILKPTNLVIRNGQRQEIDIEELVPGDLVVLAMGDKVPADGEIIESTNLLINEAILTGESKALNITELSQKTVHMGTTVIAGKAIMKVTQIGIKTEIGKIGKSLAEIKDEKTPLQEKLEIFTKQLMLIIVLVCLSLFIVELATAINFWEALRLAIVLSVAAIPEGLSIVVTVILALGMKKILKQQGLVKKLLSIETLGSTSVVCTDKTGTLTEGQMKVVATDFKDQLKAQLAMILANEQKDSLEIALWQFVKQKGQLNPEKILASTQKVYEEIFDSTKKYSLTIVDLGEKENAFILGAPEIVLSFCHPSAIEKKKILAEIETLASKGLKVLGMAYKDSGNLKKTKNFIWLGCCGIEDPLRAGVKETIQKALSAGIKVKIVTGDYRKTAEATARQLGFEISANNSIEGVELEKMSDQKLAKEVKQIVIFSRITPAQKLRIVTALQKNGAIVAMTGDGVNDAPALKKANIGVVVGTATEVAKEAGDLILLDSNFKTIISAVEEGRRIFMNIKKVVAYVLSNSFVEIFLILGSVILNMPTPLTIVQILWIHLICDGPPDIALSFEPKEPDLMKLDPKELKNEKILSSKMKFLILSISLIVGLTSLFIFRHFFLLGDLSKARTIVFATVATVSLIYVFAFKNLKQPFYKTANFFKNKILFLSVLYGLGLVLIAIYLPVFNKILETTPLAYGDWLIILGVGFLATLIVEMIKVF